MFTKPMWRKLVMRRDPLPCNAFQLNLLQKTDIPLDKTLPMQNNLQK